MTWGQFHGLLCLVFHTCELRRCGLSPAEPLWGWHDLPREDLEQRSTVCPQRPDCKEAEARSRCQSTGSVGPEPQHRSALAKRLSRGLHGGHWGHLPSGSDKCLHCGTWQVLHTRRFLYSQTNWLLDINQHATGILLDLKNWWCVHGEQWIFVQSINKWDTSTLGTVHCGQKPKSGLKL